MKKKEKIMIMILLVITVIAIIMLYNQRNPKSKNEENVKEEMVMIQEDGSKIAISDKLQEKKRIEDIEINNISIREEGGLAKITASTTNVGKEETQEMPIKILLKDKDENIITEVGAYIGKMKKGDQRGIMASANVTIDEVYDVEIKID